MLRVRRSFAFPTALLSGLLLVALLPGAVLAAAPIAVNDAYTVGVGAPQTSLPVLLNDSDPDGNIIRVIDVEVDPVHGTAFPSADGQSVIYQPNAGFRGIDTFVYLIWDSTLRPATATVTVTVNDPPIAVDDPGLICGPTGGDGSPAPFGGAYPLPEDYVGSFAPTDYFILICGLLLNDTDPNGDPLTWEILTQPSHGDLIKFDETTFGYRPDPDYSTKPGDQPGGEWISDSFTYRAFDGLSYSQPATMRYWVAPINDPPTFTPGGDVTVEEGSGAYSATWATDISPGPTNESDQTVSFELQPNFPVEQHGPGILFTELPAIDSNGVLTFTIGPNVYGLAHVTFRAKDDGGTLPDYAQGTNTPKSDDTADDVSFDIVVTHTVPPVTAVDDDATLPEDPDPSPWPVAVLANDTYPDGSTITSVTQGALGEVTIAPDGQSVLYAPQANATGSDSFTYTLRYGLDSESTATVSVSITPANDPPAAMDDFITIERNERATEIDALGNDSDVDSPSLTITGTSGATLGKVVITGGGTGLTYEPKRGMTGTETFTYTISDGDGGVSTATVCVTVVKPKHGQQQKSGG